MSLYKFAYTRTETERRKKKFEEMSMEELEELLREGDKTELSSFK